MATKIVVSPLASAKLNFRTRASDSKNELFEKRKLVIYTPLGEVYQVSIKGKQKNGATTYFGCPVKTVHTGERKDLSDDEMESTMFFHFSCSG